MTVQAPQKLDLVSQRHKIAPDATFAPLRKKHPIASVRLPIIGNVWMATRHEDVESLLKDHDRFVVDPRNAGRKNRPGFPAWLPNAIKSFEQNMASQDDPDHLRLRKLVNQAFSRRNLDDLIPQIEQIADVGLDRMEREASRSGGPVDLVANFSRPLPLTVICEVLGVPHGQRDAFARWSKAMATAGASFLGILKILPRMLAMRKELIRLLSDETANPTESLIGGIVRAEADGESLSRDEALAMLLLLIVAGHETTVHVIGNGVRALLLDPEKKAELLASPELIDSAVEEIFRRETSVEFVNPRYAVEDHDWHGTAIKRGDAITPAIFSANHDPRVFDHPLALDLARKPNPHVTFGGGIHFCLGVQLARLELRIALQRLFARFPDVTLADPAADPKFFGGLGLRGLSELMVHPGG